jgi:site-specific DNA-cytosine methylase
MGEVPPCQQYSAFGATCNAIAIFFFYKKKCDRRNLLLFIYKSIS